MQKHEVTLTTDSVMWGVYQNLHLDLFQHVQELPAATVAEERARDYQIPMYASPYNVKCRTQLRAWLKRYRFESDVFTDDELESRTNEKFLADQLRIGTYKPLSYRADLVLRKARVFIKSVLGDFVEEEIYPYCRFSRNSTVGFGGEDVYLDKKIFKGTHLTGTEAECAWFTDYVSGDPGLRACISRRALCCFDSVDSLKQVNVPKTAVILRPVRPNTLIGSFRSIGIGELVKQKFKERLGVDLNYLQGKHQRWAQKASRRMHLVTADLSSASDSFTPALMNRLLPRSWYNALRLGRTPYVEVGGRKIWSPSFMAMGIGYTFPVMTLCFTAILRAIQQLNGTSGLVSVFGDDLIYPSNIHHYVVGVLNDLNFRLNMDKTFTRQPFRESCGGDYYDAVDVRPARPEGVSEVLKGNAIAAYVYKLFNSLVRRWEEVELPLTFSYLRGILQTLNFSPFSVPDDFPDSSGFKDGRWKESSIREVDDGNRRKPFYQGRLIPCLQESGALRPVGQMGIYLWETLQEPLEAWVKRIHHLERGERWMRLGRELLVWRRVKRRPPKGYKPNGKGKSYRKLVAFVARRDKIFISPTLALYTR